MWLCGWSFREACDRLGDYLGAAPVSTGSQKKPAAKPDPMEGVAWVDDEFALELAIVEWCSAKKGITPEVVKRYGVRLCKYPKAGPNQATCLAFLGRCPTDPAKVLAVLLYR